MSDFPYQVERQVRTLADRWRPFGPTAGSSVDLGWVNVKDAPYNAVGNGSFDDLSAIQAALDTGLNVYFPNGTYNISGTLTISPYQQLMGQGRDTVRITATTSAVALKLPRTVNGRFDVNASLRVSQLSVYAKNAVEINDISYTPWDDQSAVQGAVFFQCIFFGEYDPLDDPLAGTITAPTLPELVAFGCGFKVTKLYGSLIQDCIIRNFGIGIYADACDLNVITQNRIQANARHVHLARHDQTGSQNTIQNNDILLNYRVGGIYEDQTRWNFIENNYFETNLGSSQYWINDRGEGTIFENNRIDAPVGTVPIFSLNCSGPGVVVSNNRGARGRTIEILNAHWSSVDEQQTLVSFVNNLTSFPETLAPQCSYSGRTSSRTWGPYSPKRLQGGVVASYPWATAPSGLLGITTGGSADTLIIRMDTESTDDALEVSITGEMLTGPGGFIGITWGGTSVWSANWFTTTGLQTVTRTLLRPAGVLPNSGLIITLASNQGYLCGIALNEGSRTAPTGTVTTFSASSALAWMTATVTNPTSTPDLALTFNTAAFSIDNTNRRIGVNKAVPAYTGDFGAGGSVSASYFRDGADVLLDTSGTTVRHGVSSTWVQHQFYCSGSNMLSVNSTTTTVNSSNGVATPKVKVGGASGSLFTMIAAGTGTLAAGTATVLTGLATATANIQVTRQLSGGTPGAIGVVSRVNGVSFTVGSTDPGDTSTFGYVIFDT